MAETIEQPTVDLQALLDDLMSREPDVVTVCGRKHRIGWLHNGTTRKFSHIMLKEEDPWKRNVKVCACILLNRKNGLLTWFLLRAWYWLYWRWLYYVKDIDQVEIMGVLDASKKKISIRAISDGYHIGDRDDGHDDDDGSSRTWPSRTRWGSAYSLSEKFPWLLERKFGIAAFDYWWGYTAAEIDLMVIDQPVISYKTEKKKSMMASRKEAAELDALTEAWEKKRKGKSLAGKELSLSEFMRG